MKLFYKAKDGGPLSHAWGYWLIEWKPVFSIALLRFEDGSREAYHNHAFNAISWLLSGELYEYGKGGNVLRCYLPSLWPIWTPRERMHKVVSKGRSWAITFRGPWRKSWNEYLPQTGQHVTLTHGRQEV